MSAWFERAEPFKCKVLIYPSLTSGEKEEGFINVLRKALEVWDLQVILIPYDHVNPKIRKFNTEYRAMEQCTHSRTTPIWILDSSFAQKKCKIKAFTLVVKKEVAARCLCHCSMNQTSIHRRCLVAVAAQLLSCEVNNKDRGRGAATFGTTEGGVVDWWSRRGVPIAESQRTGELGRRSVRNGRDLEFGVSRLGTNES
ncbi:hypothetical protein NE237_027850 [Protea cynaroides]|uniref:Uncharacterized protein n=1 Tax=Protea cynaroides TaxID=273540 RepID=A0A9Q0JUR8_9MAGN|nr:hypothetical protein NE237_027850 [Protea cynaroides]